MNKEEAIKKYGKIPLKFTRYYKYSFTFCGQDRDIKIIASLGGIADDIYR